MLIKFPVNPFHLLLKCSFEDQVMRDLFSSNESLRFSEIGPRIDSDGLSPIRFNPVGMGIEDSLPTAITPPVYDIELLERDFLNSYQDVIDDQDQVTRNVSHLYSSVSSSIRPASLTGNVASSGPISTLGPLVQESIPPRSSDSLSSVTESSTLPNANDSLQSVTLQKDQNFQRLDSVLLPTDCYGTLYQNIVSNGIQPLFAKPWMRYQRAIQSDDLSCLQDYSQFVNVFSAPPKQTYLQKSIDKNRYRQSV